MVGYRWRSGRGLVAALAAFSAAAVPIATHLFPDAIGDLVDAFERATPIDPAVCRLRYPGEVPPAYVRQGLDRRTSTICYHAFSVGYSGVTRTPLWSVERITADAIEQAHTFGRSEDFHPDPFVRRADRAQLDDYRHSGFDRGHMSPSGDMPTPEAREESFKLANIMPQDRDMNEHLWADIEGATTGAVRHLARDEGTVYVVTGPVFNGAELPTLHGRVAVPSGIYKAVLVPGRGAAAYVAPNEPGRRVQVISIAQLSVLTGIDPFPGAPPQLKATAIELPSPRAAHHDRS